MNTTHFSVDKEVWDNLNEVFDLGYQELSDATGECIITNKIGTSNYVWDEEAKKNHSELMTEYYEAHPDYRAKIGKTKLGNKYCVGRKYSIETKKKLSEKTKQHHKTYGHPGSKTITLNGVTYNSYKECYTALGIGKTTFFKRLKNNTL